MSVHDLYFLFLSLLETGKIDQEIHKYNTPGFTGCLSRVQFNQIAPLKAALRQTNASAHVHIQGELVESNCGPMDGIHHNGPWLGAFLLEERLPLHAFGVSHGDGA